MTPLQCGDTFTRFTCGNIFSAMGRRNNGSKTLWLRQGSKPEGGDAARLRSREPGTGTADARTLPFATQFNRVICLLSPKAEVDQMAETMWWVSNRHGAAALQHPGASRCTSHYSSNIVSKAWNIVAFTFSIQSRRLRVLSS